MLLRIYLIFVFISLLLLVLLTKIGLTLDVSANNRGEKHGFTGTFSVTWFLFSHVFFLGKLKKEKNELQSSILEREQREKQQKGKEQQKGEEKEKREEQQKEKGIEKLFFGLKSFKLLRQPLFYFFSDIIKRIDIQYLDFRISFGFPDPADTGIVCGFLHGLSGILYSRCQKCNIHIEPQFLDSELNFKGKTRINVKIYAVVFPLIKFIINRRTLYFIYLILKKKIPFLGGQKLKL